MSSQKSPPAAQDAEPLTARDALRDLYQRGGARREWAIAYEAQRLRASLESADRDCIDATESVHEAQERWKRAAERLATFAGAFRCPFMTLDWGPPGEECMQCSSGVSRARRVRCWTEWALKEEP